MLDGVGTIKLLAITLYDRPNLYELNSCQKNAKLATENITVGSGRKANPRISD